ncbi:hypothetical protein [Blastococcus montanus]|uniref:hypothetical protein n=1 Tax=Blastococcus montanus TaxID=3144973 RepID=UPI003208E4B1
MTTAVLAALVAAGGLAACGRNDSVPGTAAEVGELREELGALEDRVSALEEQVAAPEPTAGPPDDGGEQPGDGGTSEDEGTAQPVEDPAGVFEDPEPLVGQVVTVAAAISDLIAVTEVGAAFRLADGDGDTVGAVMVTPPADLEVGDVVRVSGPLARIRESSFEADFGIAADVLVDDPDAFFADLTGEFAIAARDVEVLQQPPG